MKDTLDLEREESGTLVIQTNSPHGHIAVRFWMHPEMAQQLRDWLNKNYPLEEKL